MDTLGIQKATLVGHSLGAMIAQWVAVIHPGRVHRLMQIGGGLLMDPPPLIGRIFMSVFAMEGVGEAMYSGLRKDPKAAYDSLRSNYADLDALPEEDRAFLAKRVQQRVSSYPKSQDPKSYNRAFPIERVQQRA
jgi:pimeloyl-ACP methyl ester carboxylesterase